MFSRFLFFRVFPDMFEFSLAFFHKCFDGKAVQKEFYSIDPTFDFGFHIKYRKQFFSG